MTHDQWGGSEVLWSESASRLASWDHEVLAVVQQWPETPAPVKQLKKRGVNVFERPRTLYSRALNFLMTRLGRGKQFCPTWRRLRRFAPDLVCISNAGAIDGLHWMMRCLEDGIPYVSISQANGENWWPEDWALPGIRRAFQGAERAFFVSEGNLRLFERQIGASLTRGEVTRNPFTVPWDVRLAWPAESDVFKLACVARLYPPAKGQDVLFQVLAQDKWRDRPVKVTLLGKGPMEAALVALADMLNLSDRVEFAGHVPNMADAWASHHALVLPSRIEGLPLCIIEAMLCGRPCIVTDVAGNRELVDDELTGFVADTPTVKDLDEAMERAWQRRAEWSSLGALAGATIRQRVPQDPPATLAQALLGCVQNGATN